MEVSTSKTKGKLHHASINPKNITMIPYHIISTLLNVKFDFDISITNHANDVAIDVAKCALLGKVMQGLPCLEVCTLTNEKGSLHNEIKWFEGHILNLSCSVYFANWTLLLFLLHHYENCEVITS